MRKNSQAFFIKILLEIILEFQYDSFKSIILLYSYLKIIYEITSVYNLKFKITTNTNLNKTKYLWIKTLFYNDKFFEDLILFINVNLMLEINKYLNSKIINNYNLDYFIKKIYDSPDYQNFIKINFKLSNEIIILIQTMCENIFLIYYKKYLSENNGNNINYEEIMISNDFLLKNNQMEDLKKYLYDEYQKINKTQELIEILNLTNNIEIEQIIFNKSWIKLLNNWGIIGFWNMILCLCYFSNQSLNSSKELESFYKLNLYLFNGIVISNNLKNIFKNISPYDLLKNDVLNTHNKTLWFTEANLILEYHNEYDFPSEINLLSSIALNIILNIGINISDIKITFDDVNYFELEKYNNIFLINQNNNYFIINYVDWNSLFEGITNCYLISLQSYLTSHHVGRMIGNNITSIIDKLF